MIVPSCEGGRVEAARRTQPPGGAQGRGSREDMNSAEPAADGEYLCFTRV